MLWSDKTDTNVKGLIINITTISTINYHDYRANKYIHYHYLCLSRIFSYWFLFLLFLRSL